MTATPNFASDARSLGAADAAAPAGNAGPFVLNLCSSTTPMALAQTDLPELKRFNFFVSRRFEEGRERFRLHMGYFATLAEAEEWLNVVREIYPGAWAGEAPGRKLRERAAAAQAAQAAQAAGPQQQVSAPAPAAPVRAARRSLPARAPRIARPARTGAESRAGGAGGAARRAQNRDRKACRGETRSRRSRPRSARRSCAERDEPCAHAPGRAARGGTAGAAHARSQQRRSGGAESPRRRARAGARPERAAAETRSGCACGHGHARTRAVCSPTRTCARCCRRSAMRAPPDRRA